MKILSKMNVDIDVLEFFANHDIDDPIYVPNIHSIENQDINMHLHWRMELMNKMGC